MKLSKKEQKQVDLGLEITFMHLKEVLSNPERISEYAQYTNFIPVYIKEKDKEALLLGIKPTKLPS